MTHSNGSQDSPRLVSVLMPTYQQARFVNRAIESVLAQSYTHWELIVIDDASPDGTPGMVAPWLADSRIHYTRLKRNVGLGAALNLALAQAHGDWIAYLPSDDLFFADHLAVLTGCLAARPEAMLAFSGVQHHYSHGALGQIDGRPLQLVQVMHRRSAERWTERAELVSDDLGRLFWSKLLRDGPAAPTGRITCQWTDHPAQWHKVVQEPVGGVNLYRTRFRVRHPLRFHTTVGNAIDEVALYQRYRERPDTPRAADGLTILLVGELAYNADRVLAIEERGHRLYGLWMPEPYWYNTVGPLPFGHVVDLSYPTWRRAIRRIQPDVIYALLNWQAVPFVRQILRENPNVPLVWHFKEGPFICLEKGSWSDLVDLYMFADGLIHSSPEMQDWLATVIPSREVPALVLDGDLPKADWFTTERRQRLSLSDGQVHTVVPGRPIGLHPESVQELACNGIHLHFYGDFTRGQWHDWITRTQKLAEGYLHLHPQVDQDSWVSEFSQYDAGWLHSFESTNRGDIRRANWDDLNYPARVATLAAAGLPMIQRDNSGSIVAAQTLVRQRDLGVFYTTIEDLAAQLQQEREAGRIRENVWRQRDQFTFDAHVDRLVAFFRQVIVRTRPNRLPGASG